MKGVVDAATLETAVLRSSTSNLARAQKIVSHVLKIVGVNEFIAWKFSSADTYCRARITSKFQKKCDMRSTRCIIQ